jgi:HEAT repeat protein
MKWFVIIFLVILGGLAAFGIIMEPPSTPEALVADLQHRSAERRARAVRLLGDKKQVSAVPALLERLKDTGEVVIRTKKGSETEWKNVRYTVGSLVYDSFRMMGHQTVVPVLIEVLRSPNLETREAAYDALRLLTLRNETDRSPEKWLEWWEKNKHRHPQ